MTRGLRLLARMPEGASTTVNLPGVKPGHTVLAAKTKVQELRGVPIENQRLMHGDTELVDAHRTLASYGVRNQAAPLRLIVLSPPPPPAAPTAPPPPQDSTPRFRIYVTSLQHDALDLAVRSSDTVEEIVHRVRERLEAAGVQGLGEGQITLRCRGVELPPSYTLGQCGVDREAKLDASHDIPPPEAFDVTIKPQTGSPFSIHVGASNPIWRVMCSIHEQTGVPPECQCLVYQGEVLDLMDTVGSCGIGPLAVVSLVQTGPGGPLQPRGAAFDVFVHALTGKVMRINTRSTDTVEYFKHLIYGKEGIPPDQQRLIFKGRQLENHLSIGWYSITPESTLHLVLRLRGQGDMLSNHVTSFSPRDREKDVPLDTAISLTFDADVRGLTTELVSNLFKITPDRVAAPPVEAVTAFDPHTRSFTFRPIKPLQPQTTYLVEGDREARMVNSNRVPIDTRFDWSFTTKVAVPVQLHLLLEGQRPQKAMLVTTSAQSFDRLQDLFTGLFSVAKDEILRFEMLMSADSDANPVLEDDADLIGLRSGDRVRAVLKSSATASHAPSSSLVTPAEAVQQIPHEEFTDYTILHEGLISTISRANWRTTDVALKRFRLSANHSNATGQDMLQRELEIIGRLRHPNLVSILGVSGLSPPVIDTLVLEYMPRGSLYSLLAEAAAETDGPTAQLLNRPTVVLRMLIGIARGLDYLQQHHVIHGDVKSPNVLVDHKLNCKVGDFGLSVLRDSSGSLVAAQGTCAWMAPEALRGEQMDKQADVFSFGVIVWECVTRERPWAGMHVGQIVGAVGFANRRLAFPDECPPALKDVGVACFADAPADRPSFAEVRHRLEEAVRGARVREVAKASEVVGAAQMQVPNEYFCPLTLELMKNPVVAEDGRSYERNAIQQWINHAAELTSPVCGTSMGPRLVPNICLRSLICDFAAAHGLEHVLA